MNVNYKKLTDRQRIELIAYLERTGKRFNDRTIEEWIKRYANNN